MKSIFKDWDEIIKLPSQKEKLDKSFSKEYTPYYISQESYAATFGNDTNAIMCAKRHSYNVSHELAKLCGLHMNIRNTYF